MKKYGLFMAAALVLAACSDENSIKEEDGVVEAAEVEEVAESKDGLNEKEIGSEDVSEAVEETSGEIEVSDQVDGEGVDETGTREMTLEGSTLNSDWYEEWIAGTSIIFEEKVDFNQDGQDEIVLGTAAHLVVGAFNESANDWKTVYHDEIKSISFAGIMENDEVGKIAAVVTDPTDADSDKSSVVRLLRYSEGETGLQVVEAFRSQETVIEGDDLEYEVNNNVLSINSNQSNGLNRDYELNGNSLQGMNEDIYLFDGLPLTDDQKFINLFPEFFASDIVLGDSYETVIEKAGEGTGDYHYGSPMLNYDGYSVLYQNGDKIVDHFLLTGNGELTVQDLEKATGQDLKIESLYTDIEGYIHYATFTFDGVPYKAYFKSEEGNLKFLSVGQ